MKLARLLAAPVLLAGALAAPLAPSAASADDPKPPPTPTSVPARPPVDRDAAARAAAQAVVAADARQLHLSRHDEVAAGDVLRSGALRFVPYERTYRGIPVVGGDFVVVVDGDGNVVHTSVAQTDEVSLPDVLPAVAAPAARSKAAAKVDDARLSRSDLVVLQRGDRSDLAWRTTATGRRAGQPSRLDVYVDADSGEVLRTDEHVQHGNGHAGWSGPNPVNLRTTHPGSVYSMTTPGAPSLVCQDSATNTTFTGADDVWGNGDPAVKETGCVDALYAAQQMQLMMKGWLGRDGMNAMGGWLPIRVGLNDNNAYYDGTQIQIGHNTSGQWVGSLDITAHEFGHGVDDHTPGGLSRGNTSEFVADVFGAAAEYYDNQPAPYDVPDFLIGEEVNLVGSGEIRNMVNPAVEGDPACWSPAVDDTIDFNGDTGTEVHAAAGPGDHWFYLAAIGSNAAGQPASPTCNGSNVLGIGVQKATKIFYTAMLMKTSASSYKKYREWTLVAARNLYGQSTCTEFNRVRAAWDAVSVPALAGEVTCTPGQPAVRVTNATTRTATAGVAIAPFTLTAAGGSGSYSWSATGLPAGLAISPGTGQVSGTPATNAVGSHTVRVTATDTVGRVGTGWFNLTVNTSTSDACSGDRLGNGGFENPTHAPWTMPLWAFAEHSSSRTGARHAWLGGYGETASDTMTQQLRLPAGACRATLTFHVWSLTQEGTTSTQYDKLTVKANNYVLLTRSNLDAVKVDSCPGACPETYVKVTKVIPAAFLGKNVTLSFSTQEDGSLWTNWHVDDIAVTVTPAP